MDTKLDEVLARQVRIEATLERIEEALARIGNVADQAVAGQSFPDRMAAYVRSRSNKLPILSGGG
jgi:hypothetical protein